VTHFPFGLLVLFGLASLAVAILMLLNAVIGPPPSDERRGDAPSGRARR
jgi:hypothetical protein